MHSAGICSPRKKSISVPSMPRSAARTLLSSISSVGNSPSGSSASYRALKRWASEIVSAASAIVCSSVVCWSKMRVSTVPRLGWGRTSHQR